MGVSKGINLSEIIKDYTEEYYVLYIKDEGFLCYDGIDGIDYYYTSSDISYAFKLNVEFIDKAKDLTGELKMYFINEIVEMEFNIEDDNQYEFIKVSESVKFDCETLKS